MTHHQNTLTANMHAFDEKGRHIDADVYVLVEGPAWGDAKFYGEWLLAAAKAESFWKEALGDQDFKKGIETVSFRSLPDFGIAATTMLMRLKSHWTRFVIDIDSEEGEDFAMMLGMGFFVRKVQSYQMTLPSYLTAEKVRAAVVEYAKTETVDSVLHPEDLVITMPFAAAMARRLARRGIGPGCLPS